jgi:enamine deaminase RidA (YjgF/YER057c/UK114 family)
MPDPISEPVRIDPPGWLVRATMAQAVVYNGIAYLSGVVPTDLEGRLIGPEDAAAQATACIDSVETILKSAGASLDDILRTTCFATSIAAGRAYIAERSRRMTNRPAATTVLVSDLLVPGAMLEVEVIARVSQAN